MGLGVALFLTFAFAAFASDTPPPDDTDTKSDATPLRRIDQPTDGKAAAATPAATTIPKATTHEDADDDLDGIPSPAHKYVRHSHNNNDRVTVMGSTTVNDGEDIEGDAVAVMGSMTMNGTVQGDCVAVMGDNYINGVVHGEAVAVMGDLHLGPKADIYSNLTCVGGEIIRDPGSRVRGQVVNNFTHVPHHIGVGASSWWSNGLSRGRLLTFAPETHFLLILTFTILVLSLILVIAFPRGIAACNLALTEHTGATILTGFLSILALPFLFVLLLVTVVGIPIAFLVLPLAVMAAKVFGTASILVLIAHGLFGNKVPPVLGFLIAAVILVAFLTVPLVGLPIYFLVSFLGFSSAIAALLGLRKQPAAPKAAAAVPPVVVTPMVMPMAGTSIPVVMAEGVSVEPPVTPGAPLPPVVEMAVPVSPVIPHIPPSVSLRAGFWIRMCALAIDAILIALVTDGFFRAGHVFPFTLAVYGAVLWKMKGATVGDLIFHLKVVRLDGRPVDWPTACVRALGCFISAFVIFLGFIWIAFDPEKQGWHDKIAGTIVIQETKATPFV